MWRKRGVWEEQHGSVTPLSRPRDSPHAPQDQRRRGLQAEIQRASGSSLCETASGDSDAENDTGRKELLGFAQHGSGALESSRAAPGWAASGSSKAVPMAGSWRHMLTARW